VFVVLARRKAQTHLIAGVLCADSLAILPPPTTNLRKRADQTVSNGGTISLVMCIFLLLGSCGLVGAHIVLDELTKAQVSLVFGIRLVLAAENIIAGGVRKNHSSHGGGF
jgi:hypothetical protein